MPPWQRVLVLRLVLRLQMEARSLEASISETFVSTAVPLRQRVLVLRLVLRMEVRSINASITAKRPTELRLSEGFRG